MAGSREYLTGMECKLKLNPNTRKRRRLRMPVGTLILVTIPCIGILLTYGGYLFASSYTPHFGTMFPVFDVSKGDVRRIVSLCLLSYALLGLNLLAGCSTKSLIGVVVVLTIFVTCALLLTVGASILSRRCKQVDAR